MSHETDHSRHLRKPAPQTQDDHLRDGDLHICGSCGGTLVQPLDWREASSCHWEITLRCPSCEWIGTGVFAQEAVERYDDELDRGTEELVADLEKVTATNMLEEIERFSHALHAGLIVPDDF